MNTIDMPADSIGLYVDQMARRTAMRSIFVTGTVRTGSTMMAQILHSLEGVEYLHEPHLLNLLIPAIGSFPPKIWQLMFEAYLHEEGLLEAISGRRMNLNRHDQSSIWHAKSAVEIRSRLNHSIRRVEAREKSIDHRLVIKIPDMMPYLGQLHSYYPDMNIIIMLRKPENIFLSAMEKGWYRDLSSDRSQGVSPWKSPGKPYKPFWLNDEDIDRWESISEVERACLHYVTIHEALLKVIESTTKPSKKLILVEYDVFVREPSAHFPILSKLLGLEFGKKPVAL